jgi:hypothetical protein
MLQSTDGFVKIVQDYLGVSEDIIERTGKVTTRVNAVTSLLTLSMLIAGMDVATEMAPTPLERTKSSSVHGNDGEIFHALFFDPGKLPDGNDVYACLTSFLLNAFGISFSFPAGGPISGAEILFQGNTGFATCPLCNDGYVQMDYGQFGGAGETALTTDDGGMAVLEVQGKRQAREIPEDAEPWDREFTVQVSAQPEQITGDHIFDAFFAGFSSPNPYGLLQSVIIALKEKRWDLGEFTYEIRDWREPCVTSTLDEVMQASSQGEAPPCFYTGDVTVRHDGAFGLRGVITTGVLSQLRFERDPNVTWISYILADGRAELRMTGSNSNCTYSGETVIEGAHEWENNSRLTGRLGLDPVDGTYGLVMLSGENSPATVSCPGSSWNVPISVIVNTAEQQLGDMNALAGSHDTTGLISGNSVDHMEWDLSGGSCEPSPEPICTLDARALPE